MIISVVFLLLFSRLFFIESDLMLACFNVLSPWRFPWAQAEEGGKRWSGKTVENHGGRQQARQQKIVLECGDTKIKAYIWKGDANDASAIPVKEILRGHFTILGSQPPSEDIGNKEHSKIEREVIVRSENKKTQVDRVDASFSSSDNPNSWGLNRGLTEDGDNNIMSGSSTPGSSGSGTSRSFSPKTPEGSGCYTRNDKC